MNRLRKHYKGEELMEEFKQMDAKLNEINTNASGGKNTTGGYNQLYGDKATVKSSDQPFFKLIEPPTTKGDNDLMMHGNNMLRGTP